MELASNMLVEATEKGVESKIYQRFTHLGKDWRDLHSLRDWQRRLIDNSTQDTKRLIHANRLAYVKAAK
jgi:hypothetical protein